MPITLTLEKILDDRIKNLEPTFREELLGFLSGAELPATANGKVSYINRHLGLSEHKLSPRSLKYWTLRGWTDIQARLNVRQKSTQSKKRLSPFSREFWTTKVNPNSGKHYTSEEADFERNSRRPVKMEYWVKKGWSNDDAITKAAQLKAENNRLGAKKSAERDKAMISAFNHKTPEYWILRGYTEERATSLISESQKTFSKEICIRKYGEVEGLTIWRERQEKWQTVLKNKPPEERARINRMKLSKGISVSKNERLLFEDLKQLFPEMQHQFVLENEKKQYIYDIALGEKIIEYNGDFWHCNPAIYGAEFHNPRTKRLASEVWRRDQTKLDYAKSHGFQVLTIWERDFKLDREKVTEKCIHFLTQP